MHKLIQQLAMKNVFFITISFLFFFCKPIQRDHLDEEDAISNISQTATAFSKAVMNEDVNGIMSCYTEDAVIYPPGRTAMTGAENLRQYWGGRSNRDVIYHMIIPNQIELKDSFAIDQGVYEGQAVVDGDTLNPFKGKYLVIWKLESDGQWRMKHDMWNGLPRPPENN